MDAHYLVICPYNVLFNVREMSEMLMIGAFGATLIGLGVAENMGLKVNEGSLRFVMEMVKFGAVLYILKMAAALFL